MLILGIDTSFDDTSVAIVENGTKILANEIISQKNIHEKTGGVVPEIAARTHVERIIPTLKSCLQFTNYSLPDIDAIAVTSGPGLVGSLLVGTGTASTLGMFLDKPLYSINHIWGHLYANFLERNIHEKEDLFPILVLTVAGGHNDLVLMKDWFDFEIVGSTRDDASGEAFDKCARLLGIADFMGGPELSRFAAKGKPNDEYKFPRAMSDSGDLDFSFSGLKTAVRQTVEKIGDLNEEQKYDLAYELQEAICESLIFKLNEGIEKYKPNTVFVTGGVSANDRLKELLIHNPQSSIEVFFPSEKKLSTDNAAMIAGACYFLKDYLKPEEFVLASPNLHL